MKRESGVLRVLLAVFTAINAAMAVLSFSTKTAISAAIVVCYGATVDLTPQMIHLIRMFGAWNITLAFLGAAAFARPRENRVAIHAGILLLAVRCGEMVVFSSWIVQYFAIQPARLAANAASYLVMAVLLWIFRPKATA